MDLQNIKQLLPIGSYLRIAQKVGISIGTVRQVFASNVQVRISEETELAIRKEALKIIEEQKDKAELLLNSEAAIAA